MSSIPPQWSWSPIATVSGQHTYSQAHLAKAMRATLAEMPDAEAKKLQQVVSFMYERSNITARHLELTLDEIDSRTDWARMVNRATQSMSERVLGKLFDADRCAGGCGVDVAKCDGLVVVTSSYIGFPSLSRQLQERCGFQAKTLCYDLTGLGCAGPTQGLYLAHTLLETGACNNVCVLCVDAYGTQGQSRKHPQVPSMSQLVAHCIASDAAGAVVLGRDACASPLLSYSTCGLFSELWRDALQENDLTVCEANQPFIAVGKNIRTRLVNEVGPLLDERDNDKPIFFHPGGAALMQLLAQAYPNFEPSITVSNGIMNTYGNVGSSSVLLVLAQALKERTWPLERGFSLFALGPGIVTTVLNFDGVKQHGGSTSQGQQAKAQPQ